MSNPTLLPFQLSGVQQLTGRNMLLGDQAGTGKTPQMIELTKTYNKVLVLTMASLKFQMEAEIKKWLPNATTQVINGSPSQRKYLWGVSLVFDSKNWVKHYGDNIQYYIANYELLLKDLPQMQSIPWDYIVCDECTRLSNHTNKQWKALRLLKSTHKLAMTGTAISNSPLDCWGIFEWLNPSSLGNFWAFSSRYVVKDHWGSPRYFIRLDELAKRIQPFYIRRTKEQVLPELPEKRQIDVPFELSAPERKLYDQLKSELLFDIEQAQINKIEHISQLQSGLVKLLRLRQLTCSMELLGDSKESSKLTVLKDLIKTII